MQSSAGSATPDYLLAGPGKTTHLSAFLVTPPLLALSGAQVHNFLHNFQQHFPARPKMSCMFCKWAMIAMGQQSMTPSLSNLAQTTHLQSFSGLRWGLFPRYDLPNTLSPEILTGICRILNIVFFFFLSTQLSSKNCLPFPFYLLQFFWPFLPAATKMGKKKTVPNWAPKTACLFHDFFFNSFDLFCLQQPTWGCNGYSLGMFRICKELVPTWLPNPTGKVIF